jgi:hypothetical protein
LERLAIQHLRGDKTRMIHVRGEDPSRGAAAFSRKLNQKISKTIRFEHEPRVFAHELSDVSDYRLLDEWRRRY